MECIVHYGNQRHYSVLKKLSAINSEQINLAREKRLQIGSAQNNNQCDQIPSIRDPEIHGIHLEPCYKR